MNIAVISDTHLAAPTPWLARIYERYLAPADMLIHCGDTTGYKTWLFFTQHPNFHAVAGNSDEWTLADELPTMLTIDLDGLKVGVAHGWGDRTILSRTVAEAFGTGYGLILFGHSHRPEWTTVGSTPVLNPGSLKEAAGNIPSLAIIDYTPGTPLTEDAICWIEPEEDL